MHWHDVDLGPGVRAGFTGADANLSAVVGDPDDAAEHRRALGALLGGRVVFVRQVHGAAVVDAPLPGPLADLEPPHEDLPAADALVAGPGTAVGVMVADCVPVLLADPVAGVVGAVHAGRRGLAAGVVQAALDRMAARGSRPGDIRAAVGPAVCGRCYEVPAALRAEVAAAVPGTGSTTSWGTPALDLPAGVRGRLESGGVGSVEVLTACTLEDPRWFSHRGSSSHGGRPPGRFAGVVRIG